MAFASRVRAASRSSSPRRPSASPLLDRARTSPTSANTKAPSCSTGRSSIFQAHRAFRNEAGTLTLEPTTNAAEGFFTSYLKDGKTVSFYGDNHPYYAGSVVKAMASAKDGYARVVELFPELATLDCKAEGARRGA